MSVISFSHYDYQCPWTLSTKEFLKKYCQDNKHEFIVKSYSKPEWPQLMGFPFITSLDGKVITGSPIHENNIADLFKQEKINQILEDDVLENGYIDKIERITTRNIKKSISICLNGDPNCIMKEKWYKENKEKILGYIGNIEDKPSVLFEALCETSNKKTAYVTCFYSRNDVKDYKKSIFELCIPELRNKGIRRIEIIVGEKSYYPNGTKKQFEDMGFIEIEYLGKIYLLNRGIDNIYKLGITF